ncbi:unnamed protein product [Spirodela intermedia]|uniref:Uncharacterized protein n=1 Tax=Spirodela intermedia TaxID=51605 RepID=A0A7I8K753_SPIIN|nr:unnamed protein product [Spirodela intermedia]
MDNVTASEVAGMAVGALLLAATVAAPRVDAFISASQRRSLRMCSRCGDLRVIPCSKCGGAGVVSGGGLLFGLPFLPNPSDERSATAARPPCPECRSKGRIPCPLCSGKLPSSSSPLP